MKLHHNPASPYVRKVLVTAHECGLIEHLQMVSLALTPVNPNEALNAANPLGKIPALVLDDGEALFDSRVICEYLDSLHGGEKMFPAKGERRWLALRRQALADGILDAAVNTRYETVLRPEALRWADWSGNQKLKIQRAASAFEREAEGFADSVDIGTVAVGCALSYLDFRYADDDWREGCPSLAVWYEAFAKRPSMQATMLTDLR